MVKTQISFCFEKSDEQQILQGYEQDSDQKSAIPSVSLSKYLFYIKQASKNFNAFRCLPSFNSVSLFYQNSMPLRMQWNSLETLSVCSKNACGWCVLDTGRFFHNTSLAQCLVF